MFQELNFKSHFRALLRGLGAFFIKRKIDAKDGSKDYIYRSLLQTYMQESVMAGHNLEFFIEGGRTRTGKPCMPKVKKGLSFVLAGGIFMTLDNFFESNTLNRNIAF